MKNFFNQIQNYIIAIKYLKYLKYPIYLIRHNYSFRLGSIDVVIALVPEINIKFNPIENGSFLPPSTIDDSKQQQEQEQNK